MGQITQTTAELQVVLDQQDVGNSSTTVGWDDLVSSLIGRRLASTSGKVDYNYGENSVTFAPGGNITNDNDCVVWNLQKPHKTKTNSVLKMHFHYWQPDDTDREFTLRYRIQSNDTAKTTAWTEVIVSTNANNTFTYTSGTLNQICTLADVDWSAANLSSTVQLRMARTDSESGNLDVTFVDGHFATDQERGSRQEFVK